MDTGILLNLIDDLLHHEKEYKINSRLNSLKSALTQSKGNQPNAGKTIRDNIDYLKENLIKGRYQKFTRSYFKALNEIGGSSFFGLQLVDTLHRIFEEEQYSIDNQTQKIGELFTNRTEFFKKIDSVKTDLEYLNLEEHFHTDNIYEIGIIIPDSHNLHYAKQLENIIHNWNLIIKGLNELTGKGSEDIKIERVYNGCIELIIEQAFNVASSLGEILKELVSTYLVFEKIRKHVKELRKEGVTDKVLKPIEDQEASKLEDDIDKLTKNIIKKYKDKNIEKGRLNELEKQLKNGIKYIAKSLEKGIEVEIIPPYEGQDEELKDEDSEEVKKKKVAKNKDREKLKTEINTIREVNTALIKMKDIQNGIFNLIQGGEGKIDEDLKDKN